MKKLLIVLAIVVFSLAAFFPYLRTGANRTSPLAENEPDLPGFLDKAKGTISKEDFMSRRAEYIGLKRGIEKDKPYDPKIRQQAIAELEKRQEKIRVMPESNLRESLLAAWTPIGPAPIPNGQTEITVTPVSGRTTAIAVHPTNPNIVYVGTAQGGLYGTTDGGTNWTPLMDNAMSLAIGAVAIAPSNPETVYVGTGEPNFSLDSFFGVGVYRIENASSATPTVIGPLNRNTTNQDVFSGSAVSKILVDPTNANNIFVGTTFGFGGMNGTNPATFGTTGLFRSTNGASAAPTFSRLDITGTPFVTERIYDLVMEPGNPNRIICAAGETSSEFDGIYLTTNALAATPTFTKTFNFTQNRERTELAINKVGSTVTVFAATARSGGSVFRSIDGGVSFTQTVNNSFCAPQCFYDIAIDVEPNDASRVYLGGSPALVFGASTNGGASFTESKNGLHVDTHAIAVAPSLPSTIYLGTDGGIYKSTDSGANWVSLNNSQFSATQFMSIAVHPSDPEFTIGGTQDNGTNLRNPDGTWRRADSGDSGNTLIDQNATNTTTLDMYHTYFANLSLSGYAWTGSIATAQDNGWVFRGCNGSVAGNGINCFQTVLFYPPLEQGPGNPNTIYYGSDRLYRSADKGVTHTVVSQVFTSEAFSAIGISPQNDNVRIIGTRLGSLYGTNSGSSSLIDLNTNFVLPQRFVARAVVSPTSQTTAYVTYSAFNVTNVWKTTNLNANPPTWTAAVGSGANILPRIPVTAFIVDPLNPNTLYAGTDIGVYSSTDGGATWMPFGTGLPRVAVFDMTMSANRQVRIATHGRGMWQIPAASPTAASVSVSGQILSPLPGMGVSNAFVTITDANGESRRVMTNPFGYYRFDEVTAGETYVFTVTHKRYRFAPTVISVVDEMTELNFMAEP